MTDRPDEIDAGIFKACDLRGLAGKNITPPVFRLLGRAVGSELGPETVVVGGDVRPSSGALKDALIDGLVASGCRVTDIGIVPTPALYFAKRHSGHKAALMVTASHNPPKYNGLKLMLGDEPTTPEIVERVKRRALSGHFAAGAGSVETVDIAPDYLQWLRESVASASLRKLRVLVDAGTGCMSGPAPAVLRTLGFEVVALNCEPDGTFPMRSPNPSVFANLSGTAAEVRKAHVDFAVAFDGDGDRAVFMDETGAPVATDRIAIFFVRHLLEGHAGAPVVYDIKCSDWVRREIEQAGGRAVIERSGHSFIRKRMMVENALFGAEVSGHYFFRELNCGDDGLYATLQMARCISEGEGPFSAQLASVPVPVITDDIRIELPESARVAAIERFRTAFPDRPQLTVDGIRIEWPHGWALCRLSVTEPVITLRFEAETPAQLRSILAEVADRVPEVRERLEGDR